MYRSERLDANAYSFWHDFEEALEFEYAYYTIYADYYYVDNLPPPF